MAATEATDNTVSRLAQRLECELQSYNPTRPPQPKPGPQRHLFQIGPAALGLWHPDDAVHLVCLTDNSLNTFWEYVAEKLEREDLPKFDCVISSPDDEVLVWLHYCKSPRHFDLIILGAYGFPDYPATAQVPRYMQQHLARLQDTWYIIHELGDKIDLFREAYRALRSWAAATGIISRDFNLLSDDTALLWMLFHVFSTSASSHQDQLSLNDAIKLFANLYQTPESIDVIFTLGRRRTYTTPAQINNDSKAILADEVCKLAQNPSLLTCSRAECYRTFCESYKAYLLVSAECWAPKQHGAFHSQLMNDLFFATAQLRSSGIIGEPIRTWPYAFKPSDDEWNYVIGIGLSKSPAQPLPDTTQQKLAQLVNTLDVEPDSSIGRATITTCQPEEALTLLETHATSSPSSSQNNTSSNPPPSAKSPPQSSTKFPPASQVLSRLRWDPAHASQNYEVGYLDRFEGLMWLPLEKWGRATEDEDFVPEHRIRVFRRILKGGGKEVVWEREKRFCELGG